MIFSKGYKITQLFGNNPEYYKQFGFAGHEGSDLVPEVKGDDEIFCVEGGEVLTDQDDPKSGAYGNYVVIWNRQTNRSWWYCHLALNFVAYRKVVNVGEKIGIKGASGNTAGPHLHLNLRYLDKNGNPLNMNNGNKGFVDPLPILKILENPPMSVQDEKDIESMKKLRQHNSEYKDADSILKVISNKDEIIGLKDQDINTLKSSNNSLINEVGSLKDQLINSKAQAFSLSEQLKELQNTIEKLTIENEKLKKPIEDMKVGDLIRLLFKNIFNG